MSYIRRLQKLEDLRPEFAEQNDYSDIINLIDKGTYYDSLTDEQQERFWKYYGQDRKFSEMIHMEVNGNLHFKIERKPKPPTTPEELQERIKEVQTIIKQFKDEYHAERRR